MRYRLFFRDELFREDDFYMVTVSEKEFFARIDFVSEKLEIIKKKEDEYTNYYANDILIGVAREKFSFED